MKELHKLQYDGIALDDKKSGGGGKGKGDDNSGNVLDLQSKKQLDLDKIERTMPGLLYYKEPSEEEIKVYLQKSDPTSWYNNIWIFIITATIMMMTIISIESKMAPHTAYVLTKTNESLMRSQNLIEDVDYEIDD